MLKNSNVYVLSIVFVFSLLLAGCWQSTVGQNGTKAELVIINVLDKQEFDDCHITGSIHISFDAFESAIKTLSKTNHYVIYCADYMCMASGFCARLLKDAGFEHVWAYEGGMAEWYQKGYPYQGPAALEYLKAKNSNEPQDDNELIAPVITAEQLQEKIKQFTA